MNLATVWGMLGFFATGDQVFLRPTGGPAFNRLHCSQGTKGNTSIHTSFIAFLRRGFHTTRKGEGLDVGEDQEKSGHGEYTLGYEGGTEAQMLGLPQASPASSFTDIFLIQVLGSHKLCFKYKKNSII